MKRERSLFSVLNYGHQLGKEPDFTSDNYSTLHFLHTVYWTLTPMYTDSVIFLHGVICTVIAESAAIWKSYFKKKVSKTEGFSPQCTVSQWSGQWRLCLEFLAKKDWLQKDCSVVFNGLEQIEEIIQGISNNCNDYF